MHEDPSKFSSDSLSVSGEVDGFATNPSLIQALMATAIQKLGIEDFELAVQFVDVGEMQKFNKQYRGLERSTDVLSFAQLEWDPPLCVDTLATNTKRGQQVASHQRSLGDIIISLPDAWKNAQSIGHTLDRECCFLALHGLLHLCGHDHQEAEEETTMLANQNLLLEIVSPPHQPNWLGCAEKLETPQ